MNKKNILTLVALMLTLTLALCACGKEELPDAALQQQIAALQQENEQLKNEIAVLTGQLETFQTAVLKDWSLTAAPLADNSGATLTFSGVPATPLEGMTATLVIQLNGLEAESIVCTQDGDAYTASIELPAVDGYGYYCLLSGENSTQQLIPLITPETGGDQSLVNLGSSLSAYCNLFVDQWSYDSGKLTIDAAYAQAQMPSLTTDGKAVTVSSATLIFRHNGQELERQTVTLSEGEGEGTFEAAVQGVSFSVPTLEDDHQFDLELLVALSNGSSVSFNGCSWFVTEGQLNPIMG